MRRNREQRLCELTDRWDQEILDILRCQHHDRFSFSYPLHGVPNVLNRCQIGKKHVQLVDCRNCVSNANQRITHIGKNIEQHCVAQTLIRIHKTPDAETNKHVVYDICVAVKILTFRSHAHRVNSQAYPPQHIFRVKVFLPKVVFPKLLFAQGVQVCHHWVVRWLQLRKICFINVSICASVKSL